jgi:hypothetical protein
MGYLLSKSVHRRFVHLAFKTHGDYTPTRATQCANVVWSDLVRDISEGITPPPLG